VFAGDAWDRQGPMTLRLWLRPGDYRVDARLGAMRAGTDLAVGTGPARADLVLRKP
jgi:hypothetical protein